MSYWCHRDFGSFMRETVLGIIDIHDPCFEHKYLNMNIIENSFFVMENK